MTNQEKHAALLMYCVRAWRDLDTSHQSILRLEHRDVQEVLIECEFRDEDELRFYIRSLADQGHLDSHVTGAGIAFRITMAGFQLAEALGA